MQVKRQSVFNCLAEVILQRLRVAGRVSFTLGNLLFQTPAFLVDLAVSLNRKFVTDKTVKPLERGPLRDAVLPGQPNYYRRCSDTQRDLPTSLRERENTSPLCSEVADISWREELGLEKATTSDAAFLALDRFKGADSLWSLPLRA